MTRIDKYRGIETDTGNVINMDEVSDYIRTRGQGYYIANNDDRMNKAMQNIG